MCMRSTLLNSRELYHDLQMANFTILTSLLSLSLFSTNNRRHPPPDSTVPLDTVGGGAVRKAGTQR